MLIDKGIPNTCKYMEGGLHDDVSDRGIVLYRSLLVVFDFGFRTHVVLVNETISVVNRKTCSMSPGMTAAGIVVYQADKQTVKKKKEYEWQPSKESGRESAKIDQSC